MEENGRGAMNESTVLAQHRLVALPSSAQETPFIGRGQAPEGAAPPKRLLRARIGWILLVTLVVTATAAMLSSSPKAKYSSKATVLVGPRTFPLQVQPQAPNMPDEKALASSGVVTGLASRALGVPASELSHGLSISVPLNTDLLQFSYSYSNAAEARRRAQGLADAYVTYRSTQVPNIPPQTSTSRTPPVAGFTEPAAVITPASIPGAPSKRSRTLDIGVGVLLGLVLGVATAILRDRLDDRLRGPEDLEELVGANVLGQISRRRRLRDLWSRSSVPNAAADPRTAQSYRALRTRVLSATRRTGGKLLLVTSPGQEDKARVAADLAATVAAAGKQVILLGADIRNGHRPAPLGTNNTIGLSTVVTGATELSEAIQLTEIPGLTVLPSGPPTPDPEAVLEAATLPLMLICLQNRADLVVIDGPSILAGAVATPLGDYADMILVVGDARASRRAQVAAAARLLRPLQDKVIGCVLEDRGPRTKLGARAARIKSKIGSAVGGLGRKANDMTKVVTRPDRHEEALTREGTD
jgi:capsular exopolysaccharide synthesis family protein